MRDDDGDLRAYLVWVRIDGTARLWRIACRDQEDARIRPLRDLHRGGTRAYTTVDGDEDGQVTVRWENVATVEVGTVHSASERPSVERAGG